MFPTVHHCTTSSIQNVQDKPAGQNTKDQEAVNLVILNKPELTTSGGVSDHNPITLAPSEVPIPPIKFGADNYKAPFEENIIKGKQNQIEGSGNSIEGDNNIIKGEGNKFVGLRNVGIGSGNTFEGEDNIGAGDDNIAKGKLNQIAGAKNVALGNENILYGESNYAKGHQNSVFGEVNRI